MITPEYYVNTYRKGSAEDRTGILPPACPTP